MYGTLLDLVRRDPHPAPWAEGDNIPWDEPEFSERMLEVHLSQDSDLASRRRVTIERQVKWLHSELLSSRSARVLDLACGPGLYTSELARRGCECAGIDFSPASVRHAKATAADEGLPCEYRHADVREASFGTGFDLVMMIWGQFNVFPRDRGMKILKEAHGALGPEGLLLLELQSEEQIRAAAQGAPSWHSCESGLFLAKPHLVLEEHFWDESARAGTTRFFIIDAGSGQVHRHALTNEAYSEREIAAVCESVGFTDPRWFPSLAGEGVAGELNLPVVVLRKRAGT